MNAVPDLSQTFSNSDLAGGGELGARMRERDWSQTSLGPVERWPQSLKTAVRIMLTSRQPMFVWWGEQLINLYNDAYKTIVGGKHPAALGQPASQVWREIWDQVAPRAESAMRNNEGTYDEALQLIMERNGYPEETYYTFSYSPVPNDQGGTGGIICANTDDTQRVIGERQLALLRDLAAKTADARTTKEACQLSADCLATNRYDLPFSLLYLADSQQRQMLLAECRGIARGHAAAPEAASLDGPAAWPFADVIGMRQGRLIGDLGAMFGGLPTGAWDRPPSQAIVMPIAASGRAGRAGVLVAGLNPFRLFDNNYKGFIELVAAQIAAGLANAQAYEDERNRAETLAELDRVKTAFFSNVSHEFRTPLTLMLGPLEDVLARQGAALPAADRDDLQVVHRNGLRLLKLVNTLLDFSRIEAGRVEAIYTPTDLAALTTDLSSVFRSAIERAGLCFTIDCPALAAPVYVDREMWEKVVLNLLSNAFKFTFEGQIVVRLRTVGDTAELSVTDTGIGIPAEELPRLFERFHRVEGARGRTYEGSGIGLALVQELVRLHGGAVRVASQPGQGSTFIVSLPLGSAHLPAERIQSRGALQPTGTSTEAFVEEALRWLPDESSEFSVLSSEYAASPQTQNSELKTQNSARVLLADDNADMRDYMRRLLSQQYQVEIVADGEAALAAARDRVPDLILSDVMMPRLDGFGLLRELRADERTRDIPLILLSARAGEESKVEGLAAGADDYLVKPFSARELLARIDARLELTRLRREATRILRESEATLRLALQAARMVAWEWDTQQNQIITTDTFEAIYGLPAIRMVEEGFQLVHPEDQALHQALVQRAASQGGTYHSEFRILRPNSGAISWIEEWGFAIAGEAGAGHKLVGVATDITELKIAEAELREREARYRQLADAMPQLVWTSNADGAVDYYNSRIADYGGLTRSEGGIWNWQPLIHPDDLESTAAAWQAAAGSGQNYASEHRMKMSDGTFRWHLSQARPARDADGRIVKWYGTATDIHEQKQAEQDTRFLADLAERIRLSDDADLLTFEVARAIGEHLKVRRCFLTEIDLARNTGLIRRDYCWDVPSVAGTYRLSDYSPETQAQIEAGHTIVNHDSRADPRTAMRYETTYAPNGERAYLAVPLIRQGRWTAALWASTDQPRQWQLREVALLETVAERTWLAVEKLRLEQAHREAEERIKLAVEAAEMGTWELQPLTGELRWDDRCKALFGLAIDAQVTYDLFLASLHPDDREPTNRAVEWSLKPESGGGVDIEYRAIGLDDGVERWIAAKGQAYFDAQGQAVRYSGTVRDISRRKRAEEQAARLLLEEQAARRQAEEASRLKDEFLATVSHELRTPLTTILGYGQMLHARKRDEPYAARVLETIVRSAKAQAQLIDDLLDVSRIVTGKLRIETQPIDLRPVVEAALEAVRPALEAKALRLDTRLQPDVGAIMGDSGRLQQVVWNLLSNAVKFTPQGGAIQVRLQSLDGSVQLMVSDTGQGIDGDFLPFVFDRFRQAEGTSNRTHGGLGLGLAIVRNLVEMHGGTVQARSAGVERGATFTVNLPLVAPGAPMLPDSAQSGPAAWACPPELEGLRVLVVEDQADILEMLRDVLAQCGAVVTACGSANEALAILRDWQADLLISDIAMPGEDGYWLIRELRAHAPEQGGDIPAIAITAYVRIEDRARVLATGFQMYVPKPVEPAELLAVVASLIRSQAGSGAA
jgi:PAS domain S-box-containing protein